MANETINQKQEQIKENANIKPNYYRDLRVIRRRALAKYERISRQINGVNCKFKDGNYYFSKNQVFKWNKNEQSYKECSFRNYLADEQTGFRKETKGLDKLFDKYYLRGRYHTHEEEVSSDYENGSYNYSSSVTRRDSYAAYIRLCDTIEKGTKEEIIEAAEIETYYKCKNYFMNTSPFRYIFDEFGFPEKIQKDELDDARAEISEQAKDIYNDLVKAKKFSKEELSAFNFKMHQTILNYSDELYSSYVIDEPTSKDSKENDKLDLNETLKRVTIEANLNIKTPKDVIVDVKINKNQNER